jgi:hypothetical protein
MILTGGHGSEIRTSASASLSTTNAMRLTRKRIQIIYKHLFPASHRARFICIGTTVVSMLFRERVAVYYDRHKKHV